MMFRRLRMLFVLAAMVFAVPFFTHAQALADQLKSQIDSHNSEIEKLEKEIAAFQKEINALGSQRSTLESAVRSLDLSRKKLSADLAITQNKIASANLRIRELSLSIGDKEQTMVSHRELIARSIRELAADDSVSLIERVAATERLADAWTAVDEAASLKRALGEHIDQLAQVKVQLTDNRDEVTRAKNQLAPLEAQLLVDRQAIDASKKAQEALLAQTRNQESAYQKILADKQAARAAFETELSKLEDELRVAVDRSRIPDAQTGAFSWPVKAPFLTQGFGLTEFARSGAYGYTNGQPIPHRGIDLRAGVGTPVIAPLSGVVRGWGNTDAVAGCSSLGKWILIDHANGLSTSYSHLSQINVEKGQTVVTGQTIGLAGNTGYSTAAHLHFVVFAKEYVQMLNFADYYRSQGKAATTGCAKGGAVIPVAPPEAYLNPLLYLPKL